jgi:hypothetical protein
MSPADCCFRGCRPLMMTSPLRLLRRPSFLIKPAPQMRVLAARTPSLLAEHSATALSLRRTCTQLLFLPRVLFRASSDAGEARFAVVAHHAVANEVHLDGSRVCNDLSTTKEGTRTSWVAAAPAPKPR